MERLSEGGLTEEIPPEPKLACLVFIVRAERSAWQGACSEFAQEFVDVKLGSKEASLRL